MASLSEPRQRIVGPLALLGVLGLFIALGVVRRATPFTTAGDGFPYFLPLIKLHTDAVLSGAAPWMFWDLGWGWTPWESGQAGVTYLPYHLANLVARALGEPALLLEVSGWGHLLLTGAIAFHGLGPLIKGPEAPARRWLWALILTLQPGPLLLGINWHDYWTFYPWFLALALWLLRAEPELPRPSRMWWLFIVGALFWWSAHPQIFVYGGALLAVWALALRGRDAVRPLVGLGVCQIPQAVSLVALQQIASDAGPQYFAHAGRGTAAFALQDAQSVPTVLAGTVFGNLGFTSGYSIWGTSEMGAGMFFAPLGLVAVVLALRSRRWAWPACAVAVFAVLALASFPALAEALRFLSLKWGWKLTTIFGPLSTLALLAFLPTLPESDVRSHRLRLALLAVVAVMSFAVCHRGLDFNTYLGFDEHPRRSVVEWLDIADDTLSRGGAPPGARIALVGHPPNPFATPPAAYPGLMGNAPTLIGRGSGHLYEPLEPAAVNEAHFGLGAPWDQVVPGALYEAEPERVERSLRTIGVDTLVTHRAGLFPEDSSVAVDDGGGRLLYVRRLADAGPWPRGTLDGRVVPLDTGAGGSLYTATPSQSPPDVPPVRRLAWERLPDGRWRGIPSPIRSEHLLQVGAAYGLMILLLAAATLLRRPGDPRPSSTSAEDLVSAVPPERP